LPALAVVAGLVLPLLIGSLAIAPAQGHDLPDEIPVRMFAKPEGDRLHVITRVPLALLEGMALTKRGPGFLDLPRLGDGLERSAVAVARTFVLFEDGARLTPEKAAWRISQPSEDAFGSFDEAQAHVLGPALPDDANVFWNQGYYDVYLQYPIASTDGDFALETQVRGLGGVLKLFVDYLPTAGPARTYEIHGGHGWLPLDPSWHAAGLTFAKLGFDHLLQSLDHLLFLLCLVLPFRMPHLWSLITAVAAFAVAHLIAVLAGALGLVPGGDWFAPLVTVLIALSIVYMAIENILYAWFNLGTARQLAWRWVPAGVFGLFHGFGLSFGLGEELQLAGAHLATSLLAFNIGVGLGGFACLVIAVPLLTLALRSLQAQRAALVIGSAFLAHTGWHWMVERSQDLRYVSWPEVSLAWPGAWLITFVLAAAAGLALLWQGRGLLARAQRGRAAP
jgi:hypothetical protein